MKEQWRKEMKQKMADYEQSAPQVSWEQIERSVAEEKQKARIVPLWTRRVAAAAAVLLLAGAGYQAFFGESETPEMTSVVAEVAQKAKTTIKNTVESTVQAIEKEEMARANEAKYKRKMVERNEDITENNVKLTRNAEKSTENFAQDSESVENSPKKDANPTETAKNQPTKPENKPILRPNQPSSNANSDFSLPSKRRLLTASDNRLTAKFYLSSGTIESGSSELLQSLRNEKYNDYGTGDDSGLDINEYLSDKGNSAYTTYTTYLNEILDEENRDTYHQPIRFGLTITYRLAERWSLESGLVYTNLSSDHARYTQKMTTYTKENTSTTVTSKQRIDIHQRLLYIGIPLKLNYQLWRNNKFNLYVAGGGMAEKMVTGKRKISLSGQPFEEIMPSEVFNGASSETKVTIRPLQFSVSGAVGAEYRIGEHFSIYAEPELNYYFDNGSNVPNFYNDKPFNFTFGVGLKMNIK